MESPAAAANGTSPEMPLAAATASNQGFLDARMAGTPPRPVSRPAPTIHHAASSGNRGSRPSRPDLPTGRYSALATIDFPRPMGHGSPIGDSIGMKMASQPFRSGICDQHHLYHANGPRLPCREHRPGPHVVCTTAKPGFYSGPTPRLQRFNHPFDQNGHRRPSRLLKPFLR